MSFAALSPAHRHAKLTLSSLERGGTIQLGLAITRFFSGPMSLRTLKFEHPDRQAIVSLAGFLAASSLERLGDRIGFKRRAWLVSSTVLQAILLTGAAAASWTARHSHFDATLDGVSRVPSIGLVALGLASASLGLQVSLVLGIILSICTLTDTLAFCSASSPRILQHTLARPSFSLSSVFRYLSFLIYH